MISANWRNVQLSGFELVRMDQTGSQKPSGGLVAYVNEAVMIERITNYQSNGVEMLTIQVQFLCSKYKYIVLYKHPGISRTSLLQALGTLQGTSDTNTTTVLVGDFNINALVPENLTFISRIENCTSLKLQNCEVTTKERAQLDLVFSNRQLDCQTHFIPWSLHFGISCTILTN